MVLENRLAGLYDTRVNTPSCDCGSGRPFQACCGPFLDGLAQPETAEALMRSRYVAYARQAIDYLEATAGGEARRTFQRKQVTDWARSARFIGLDIMACEAGGADDSAGLVEFTATFEDLGRVQTLHERSRFAREHGAWRYIGASGVRPRQRECPKVGRNASCPCGSGQKYKRCCGRQ